MTDLPRILLVTAAGGALGALSLFGLSAWVSRLLPTTFPWGTFVVNVLGCLFLGVVLRWTEGLAAPLWRTFLTVGVAGAFTTFSTFSHENLLMLQQREYGRAALYTGGSAVLGIAALMLGLALAGLWLQRAA
jgi:CrcB protein